MKTIHDELKELQDLFKNMTPEKEEEYKARFLSIQERYTSPEDAEAIGDFILGNFKYMNQEIEELDRMITIQEQLAKDKEIEKKKELDFIEYVKQKEVLFMNEDIKRIKLGSGPCKKRNEEVKYEYGQK